MAKTFEQLARDEICIYQAFAAYANITPKAVSAFVSAQGIELDDGAALVFLAEKYGFTKEEVIQAADYTSGEYNFDNNAEFILAITRSGLVRVKAGAWGLLESPPTRATQKPRALLTDRSLEREVWHAIYGRTGASHVVAWTDVQGIYPAGPNGAALAVSFMRK